ncbi:MAG: ComEC/Rec2 family competence protein, partial [Thiovulaceae bacterium]|nr:ComEC/Rec2 family competence protein [Sulfurimonadaceae bacterium]
MNAFSQPKLLQNRHDYLLTFGLLLLITTFSLTHAYQDFLKLKTFTWQEAKFTVVKQEHKVKKNYTYDQLELKNSDLHFYTHIKHPLKELRGRVVTLVFLTNNITFKNFLTSFFTYSKLLEVSRSKTQRFHLIDKIHELHESSQIANLYAALFWVEPIDPKLRDKLSALGINHLAALSGFHLGFLALILVFCFNLFIKPIQRRFYPHIHRRRFIMILTLLILFTYVWFLDFTPSLVR